MDLVELWTQACIELWEMSYKTDWVDLDGLTFWDSFKLVYLTRVKSEDGRNPRHPDEIADWGGGNVSRKTRY